MNFKESEARGHVIFDCDGTLIGHDRSKSGEYILFDGIRNLIFKLKNLNYKLYVWTGRDRASTISILKSLDIIEFFEDLRCFDDTIPKPHPQGPSELIDECVDKDKVFVIGDSPSDIIGASQFGCHFVGALWHDEQIKLKLESNGAKDFAISPDLCLPIIENYIKRTIDK